MTVKTKKKTKKVTKSVKKEVENKKINTSNTTDVTEKEEVVTVKKGNNNFFAKVIDFLKF